MNVIKLTEKLSGNFDDIFKVLESLEFTNIKVNHSKNEIRFSREEGRNPSSVRLDVINLNFFCFSTQDKGNIYTLVMKNKNYSFPQTLNYIADLLGYEKTALKANISYPFGGYYKKIIKALESPEENMPTYSTNLLAEYHGKYNVKFFNDGINYKTQELYDIGYDCMTNRITLPEFSLDGKLVGIMGRANYNCDHAERWLPIIPCSRSLTLYGYKDNYAAIQNKGITVVTESEKGVLQMESFGCHVGLATCGCHVSDTQAKYLKGLLIPKIILAYDEGLEEEFIREQAKKLKIDNQIYTNKVGYVYDRENVILAKDSKQSPTDLGKDKFKYLIKHCVEYV